MSGKNEFSESSQIFDWLSNFVNLEKGQTPPSMQPGRMRIVCGLADNPQLCGVSIHVAGSKGKGSVTAMLARILASDGLRVARYLSPHVTEYRERITLGEAFFDEDVYLAAGNETLRIANILCDPSSRANREMLEVSEGADPLPTSFELFTLFYFLCARISGCDALAVETGMGGRSDSTNIVDSAVAVITGIELEHTEFLGNTISAVAGEKAGIIKPNRPVALAEQSPEALAVFKQAAEERKAEIFYCPEILHISDMTVGRAGTNFTLNFKKPGFFDEPLRLSIAIPGEIQARNAALAVLAAKLAYPGIGAETARRALAGFELPARFEKLSEDPTVIVDGAHTDASVRLCVKTFVELYGSGGILIFGCALGKNEGAMAEALLPYFSYVVITRPGTFKLSDPDTVYGTFKRRQATGAFGNAELFYVEETAEGIRQALERAKKTSLPALGVGSFYMAAEIRRFLAAPREPVANK
jgi:dihydrofolate synthase/folylpolyglutamate synthase